MTYDRMLGWRLIPGSRSREAREERPYLIEINSKGLRDREYSYVKPATGLRSIVIGDSFVFGSGGVDHAELFTEILEGTLPSLEVINMGVPAFGLDQEVLYLRSEGLRYQPDLVILCLFRNDFEDSFAAFSGWIGRPEGYVSLEQDRVRFHPPSISVFHVLEQRSYVLGLLHRRLGLFAGRRPDGRPTAVPSPAVKRKIFRQLLLEARELSRRIGAEFVTVYFPSRNEVRPGAVHEILTDLAVTEDFAVLDFTEDFRQGGSARSYYFSRDIHLNVQGHRLAAERLHAYLVRNTSVGRRLAPDGRPAARG